MGKFMKLIRKKYSLFILMCLSSLLVAGCQIKFKTVYFLDEILEGFHFIENGNFYVLSLGNIRYGFYFDDNDVMYNSFSILENDEDKVVYLYNEEQVVFNNCIYNKKEDNYFQCEEDDKKEINKCIKTFELQMKDMKLTVENLNVLKDKVSKKEVNIEGK